MFMKNVSEVYQYNVNVVHNVRLKTVLSLLITVSVMLNASISRCSRLELHSALVIHRVYGEVSPIKLHSQGKMGSGSV
jgi:hypothetical protein